MQKKKRIVIRKNSKAPYKHSHQDRMCLCSSRPHTSNRELKINKRRKAEGKWLLPPFVCTHAKNIERIIRFIKRGLKYFSVFYVYRKNRPSFLMFPILQFIFFPPLFQGQSKSKYATECRSCLKTIWTSKNENKKKMKRKNTQTHMHAHTNK